MILSLEVILRRYIDFWQETSPGDHLAVCAFHDDDKPSMSVNVEKGVFFCHACGAKGGVDYLLTKKIPYQQHIIRWELSQLKTTKIADDFPLERMHHNLLKNAELLDYLGDKRCWTPEAIQDLKIGYDGSRVTIPVFTLFGDLANVRAYKVNCPPGEYKTINLAGFGKARLWGLDALQNGDDPVYLTEGEPDAIAARSLGLRSCTGTAGAGKFAGDWAQLLGGRSVVVAYDADEAGRAGAQKLLAALSRPAKEVRNLELSAYLTSGKDLTDYLCQDHQRTDLEEIVQKTPLLAPPERRDSVDEGDSPLEEIFEVSLVESSQEKYYRKIVRMRAMISGKTLSPYIVPRVVEITCPLPHLNMCDNCALNLRQGNHKLLFDHRSEDTLKLIEAREDDHLRMYRKLAGIPTRCQIFTSSVVQAQNIEEAKVIPDLDFTPDDSEYVIRQIFLLGHGIKPNTSYELLGLVIPHPRTQQVTYLISEAVPLEDTVSGFKVTDELISQLRLFSVGHEEKDRREAT